MQTSLKSLSKLPIAAIDGKVGRVQEVLFDDLLWNIRYWVVDSGRWFPGREVMIDADAVLPGNIASDCLRTNLTMHQIKASHGTDFDKPVCRQQEERLYGDNSWRNYWFSVDSGTPVKKGSGTGAQIDNHDRVDRHLRSSREVIGYSVQALDRPVGKLADFMIDTESWKIISLVMDIPGEGAQILHSPIKTVREINWADAAVVIDLTFEQLQILSTCFRW